MCDLVTKVTIGFTVKMPATVWQSDDVITFSNNDYFLDDADFISEEGEEVTVKITGIYYLNGDCRDNFKENWAWHGNENYTDILVGNYVVTIISDDDYQLSLEY